MRYLINYFLCISPISGLFAIKRLLLNKVGISMAHNVSVNGHTWFYGQGKVEIGGNTWIGPRCRFYSDKSVTISIGRNCDIAPEVAFVVGSHEIGEGGRRAGRGYCKSIIVEDGCWIGARVTILGGVTIGEGSVIGAGALVIDDIPPNSLALGVPAKVKRKLEISSEL